MDLEWLFSPDANNNSIESKEMDRFIGVKAISSSGFYYSKNEYETAKLKGEPYYDSFDAYNDASKL